MSVAHSRGRRRRCAANTSRRQPLLLPKESEATRELPVGYGNWPGLPLQEVVDMPVAVPCQEGFHHDLAELMQVAEDIEGRKIGADVLGIWRNVLLCKHVR